MRPLRDLGFLVLVGYVRGRRRLRLGRRGSRFGACEVRSGLEIRRTHGTVLPTFSHPFFLAQKRGVEEEGKGLGVEIEIRDGRDDASSRSARSRP